MNDNYDRIIFPDKQYNFTAPRERFISDMAKYFPGTEKKMQQYGLFSVDDLKNANNPMREKKRRAEFQTQIDELFN